MDALTVLVTGSGAPGIKGTLFSLTNNFDNRQIRTIGTDIKEDVIGKYLCDAFYLISKPSDEQYLDQLLTICEQECVDVILPQNTLELSVLADNKNLFRSIGTAVAVSDSSSINVSNNKHSLMTLAERIGVPTPKYSLVDNFSSLIASAKKLGWPYEPIIIKPPLSNGMRGVRIVDESTDLKKMFYSEKPTSLYTNMKNLNGVIGSDFPPLLIMEYLPGTEYTVDVLKAHNYTIIPRKRDLVQSGVTFQGAVEKNEELISSVHKLSDATGLDYAFGFQFKMDKNNVPKLLESNPRIQGTMVLSTFAGANIIYASVKRAMNEQIPDFQVRWDTRILRFWGGVGLQNGEVVTSL